MQHKRGREPHPAHTQSQPARKHREQKVDAAVDMTFPASDAPTPGRATSTEPPARPIDRKAPLITKEQIESAAKGAGSQTHAGAKAGPEKKTARTGPSAHKASRH